MSEHASRDENSVPTLLAVSNLDGTSPIKVYADPVTHRLLVSITGDAGTVTSVDVSGGTTGLTTSGGPVTTTGVITLSGTLAVANGGTGATTLLGAGVVTVVSSVQSTNQSADITSTNLSNTSTAGLYRVSYSLEDTTSDAAAGAVTLTFAYTAAAGAITIPSAAQLLTGTGVTQGTIFAQVSSGSIAYSTSHTGLFGNAKYALYITAERLV